MLFGTSELEGCFRLAVEVVAGIFHIAGRVWLGVSFGRLFRRRRFGCRNVAIRNNNVFRMIRIRYVRDH